MDDIHASQEFAADIVGLAFRNYRYHEILEYVERHCYGNIDSLMYRHLCRIVYSLSFRCGREANALEDSKELLLAVRLEINRHNDQNL